MFKTYLPLNDYKSIGGPTTFLNNLSKYFLDQGIPYTSTDHKNAESILFPIAYDKSILKEYKRRNKPIIQRLDGLGGFPWQSFHGLKSLYTKTSYEAPWLNPKKLLQFTLEMIRIEQIYLKYSDMVIFQSQYCRDLCFDMIRVIPEDKYTIIHNGVHNDIFYPSDKISLCKVPTLVMSGRFRRNDMLLPVLHALDSLKSKIKFKLKIVGPIETKYLQQEIKKREYIDSKGSRTSREMARELRESDIYIFSSLNAPCPNALLEAIGCGLPIVTFDYGSTPELLFFNKSLIAETYTSTNPLLKTGCDLNISSLEEKIIESISNFSHHKELALNHYNYFDFNKCGEKYKNVLEKVTSKFKTI